MAAENGVQIDEEQARQALQTLGVFVGDFDGTVYVKCNHLERALHGYGRGQKDLLVPLPEFVERLNNATDPKVKDA